MPIEAQQKNKRTCEKCFALYVINGDESGLWCEISPRNSDGVYIYPLEGECEFCRPTGKYSLNN